MSVILNDKLIAVILKDKLTATRFSWKTAKHHLSPTYVTAALALKQTSKSCKYN